MIKFFYLLKKLIIKNTIKNVKKTKLFFIFSIDETKRNETKINT